MGAYQRTVFVAYQPHYCSVLMSNIMLKFQWRQPYNFMERKIGV